MSDKPDDSYEKFQDLIFQEIKDREKMSEKAEEADRNALLADFAKRAALKGYNLRKMLRSGMSAQKIFDAVEGEPDPDKQMQGRTVMPEERWIGTASNGSRAEYSYDQSEAGNAATRQLEGSHVKELLTGIHAGLTREEVQRLFE